MLTPKLYHIYAFDKLIGKYVPVSSGVSGYPLVSRRQIEVTRSVEIPKFITWIAIPCSQHEL